ncbi:MAG: LysR family transcriptional regulator [Pseudomonadota bacterium]
MLDWTEIKTAYTVAKLGTVKAAAQELGLHRATVVRHIDSLEETLGEKIFLRHNKGYITTDLGEELVEVAGGTDSKLSLFYNRSGVEKLEGELIVAAFEFVPEIMGSIIAEYSRRHPKITIRLLSGEHAGRLEYGEAHVMVQPNVAEKHPDYIKRTFLVESMGLYATKEYLAKNGHPTTIQELQTHPFLAREQREFTIDFELWQESTIPKENLLITSNTIKILQQCLLESLAIGLLPQRNAKEYEELVQIMPDQLNWELPVVVITHRDMHRTPKVRAFIDVIKQMYP